MYKIIYHHKVVKDDIPKIGKKDQKSIKKAIESKLFESPEKYTLSLRNTLGKYRKLRVGNYRIILQINSSKKMIKILIIAHRSFVYDAVSKRI